MSYLSLKPTVSFGLVAGVPVFLDIARDRYFALDPVAAETFARVRHTALPAAENDPGIRRLLATELFALADDFAPIVPASVHSPLAQDPMPRPTFRLSDLLSVAWALRSVRRRLRVQPVDRVLGALDRRRARTGTSATAAHIAQLAARFREARALVPTRPNCLQDSLALCLWLARRSARPSLVFGVKLDPFAAHCWVQHEACILNDAPDTIRLFTPVLVVR